MSTNFSDWRNVKSMTYGTTSYGSVYATLAVFMARLSFLFHRRYSAASISNGLPLSKTLIFIFSC
jgi:hypothetical protein